MSDTESSAKNEGLLTSVAESIGSALGNLAEKASAAQKSIGKSTAHIVDKVTHSKSKSAASKRKASKRKSAPKKKAKISAKKSTSSRTAKSTRSASKSTSKRPARAKRSR